MVVPIEPYQAVPLSVILAQILRSKDCCKNSELCILVSSYARTLARSCLKESHSSHGHFYEAA